MVGVLAENWGHRGTVLSSSVESGSEMLEKMDQLRKLKVVLSQNDPSLLPEFAPLLAELQKDQPSPVRKFLAEIIGEICSKHIELIPKLVPTLISFSKDEAPPVARQAIASATFLFRNTIERIVVEGLHSSELNESSEASWTWMQNVKDAVFPMALQAVNDGVRLMAIKFVEAMILLYTPDPSGPSSPPEKASDDFDLGAGFNISWLRGGHPILKVGDLSTVAGQSLTLLLDQLRFPGAKSLSNSIIIVLVNSLSAIAKKRPSYYGRILPVLLCLDPESSVIKGVEVLDAFHALKNAFLAFLKCTHPSAAPWRLRIVEALKTMDASEVSEAQNAAVVDIQGNDPFPSEPFGIKEEEFPLHIDGVNGDHGRKRIKVEEADASIQDDGVPTKKSRMSPTTSKDIAIDSFHENPDNFNGDLSTDISIAGHLEGDDGPVHQLVGVFGALVAQGSKAASSLDILISSISSDLLAEVVLANMHHLPLSCPKIEQVDESALDILSNSFSDDQPINPSPSFVSDILSLSTRLSSLMNVQHPAQDILTSHSEGEERPGMVVDASLLSAVNDPNKTKSCFSTSPYQETIAEADIAPAVYTSDVVSGEGKIPGLGSTDHIDAVCESKDFSPYFNPEHQGGSQDHVSSGSLPLDTASSGSMSTCISETVATRIAFQDAGEVPSTSSNSVISSNQFFLPKMTVSAVDLTERQKDHLHKVSFMRMIDAHKQISLAGGSNIHFSLLACLGIECPLELDAWGLLQKHILSDYINHEGHELTLRVLYRLFQESEQDQDFFSSTTATSDYEKFLLTVTENLRDLFPASDKSLNRLLCEAPYLPQSVLKLLECLCFPDVNAKGDKELPSGDRVTQGLISVWNLILQRPSDRNACLRIALQSAVHHLEDVRMKAIRLVANKLFPISCIAKKIEDFANEMLLSVVHDFGTEGSGIKESIVGDNKDSGLERGNQTFSGHEISSDTHQLTSTSSASSSSVSEAQRRMSLYFALCIKKHSLLRQIFAIYGSMPKVAKLAVQGHIPILIRTTGASFELLGIISDPPAGCQSLTLQVLHTLTDGTVPPPELVASVKTLYDTKLKDVEILIPVLSFLSKDEVISVFPQIVNLSPDKFQAALSRILKGSAHIGPILTPEEVLIAIHGIDPEKDKVALKKVMDACTSCFDQGQVFTQQVLAKVLNQLVEQIPLPLLFMRTVIQAIGTFPALVDFVMEILSRLVNKQIWKYPKLWVGFLKCAVQTKPQSFNVLLQLPAAQLENALNRNPILKASLTEHANQPDIRTTLPRSTLVVLGLAQDPQNQAATQVTQNLTVDSGNSAADAGTEPTQDSGANM